MLHDPYSDLVLNRSLYKTCTYDLCQLLHWDPTRMDLRDVSEPFNDCNCPANRDVCLALSRETRWKGSAKEGRIPKNGNL